MTFTLRTAKPDVLISLGVIMMVFMVLELLAVFLKWGQLCRNLTIRAFPSLTSSPGKIRSRSPWHRSYSGES